MTEEKNKTDSSSDGAGGGPSEQLEPAASSDGDSAQTGMKAQKTQPGMTAKSDGPDSNDAAVAGRGFLVITGAKLW